MNDKLQTLKEKHEVEEYDLQVNEAKSKRLKRAYMFLGAVHNVKRLSETFNSQFLRGVQAIENENLYLDMGFGRFVDFLSSEESPIGKTAFYDRLKLLESEGEQVFDLLNEVGVAASTRKLLAAGNYEPAVVEGGKLKIGEREADITDVKSIKTIIDLYADDCRRLREENKKQADRIEKGKGDYDRLKQRLTESEESISMVDYSKNPIEKSNSIALGGLAVLADELQNATLVECNNFVEGSLRLLATQYNRVQAVLCEKLALESADELFINQNDEDRLTSLLDDED